MEDGTVAADVAHRQECAFKSLVLRTCIFDVSGYVLLRQLYPSQVFSPEFRSRSRWGMESLVDDEAIAGSANLNIVSR